MNIKPIETHYKGYRFRSRLEARWAVFFDAMGLQWRYEPEGFDLGEDMGCYLPDFWLPDLDCWLEVKPERPTRREQSMCESLAHGADKLVVIVCGVPGDEDVWFFCNDVTDGSAGLSWWDGGYKDHPIHWTFDASGHPVICSGNNRSDREFATAGSWEDVRSVKLVRECGHDSRSADKVAEAQAAARSARFEHGENGQ